MCFTLECYYILHSIAMRNTSPTHKVQQSELNDTIPKPCICDRNHTVEKQIPDLLRHLSSTPSQALCLPVCSPGIHTVSSTLDKLLVGLAMVRDFTFSAPALHNGIVSLAMVRDFTAPAPARHNGIVSLAMV